MEIFMVNLILIMTNEQLANDYLNWFSQHYEELKYKYLNFCKEKNYNWDEDIYSDTYLKVYDCILKKGIKDPTPFGYENYFFKAFKNNTLNASRYACVKKRDKNFSSDNIEIAYEQWYNENNDDSKTKLISDLWKDFSVLYIMMQVENNFPQEYFYLFRIKTLTKNMTFKKLQETCPNIKSTRKKVIEVQRWLKDNVKKEDIKNAFNDIYGDLIME